MFKRYIVELGTGLDLHGMDVTKAGKKAVKDAVSHSCLCGISEILGIRNPNEKMKIALKIAAPFPDKVDAEAVAQAIPFGKVETEVVAGGMATKGLAAPTLGEGDTIVMVNVSLTVYLDV